MKIGALFNAHEIVSWVDCGFCLGAYRHGGVIPWDFDNAFRLLRKLKPAKVFDALTDRYEKDFSHPYWLRDCVH